MKLNNVLKLILSIFGVGLAGAIGSVFTSSSIPNWYAGLLKPALNPPNWLFGPVWTILYLLMGISVFLVWKKENEPEFLNQKLKIKNALLIFIGQLSLNASWSILFFGLKNPGLAFIEIIILWFFILFTIIKFFQISKTAAYLLLPYIFWVSFATYLNFLIWQLN
jgi:tryptophan-rich sensory protein